MTFRRSGSKPAKRRHGVLPKPEPPHGMMFAKTGFIPIDLMEEVCRVNMISSGVVGWDNDPSYFWADKVRKKQNEQP